ncbi:hypothetical protein AHAT_23050 [Agarivorans sp. Toyoura001]|nr:hypothetical protein AHAT_23050 [Agarivorans sp. Toyoura001]
MPRLFLSAPDEVEASLPNKCILSDLSKLSPFVQKIRTKVAISPKPQMQALASQKIGIINGST